MACVKLCPYRVTEKGRAMTVLQSSQWLPMSVIPGTNVPLPVVKLQSPQGGVVGVGVTLPWEHAEAVAVGDGVGLGVGVGDGVPTAAAISTRPQPYTLFGGPAVPHVVSEIK